jgi:hypothetical protein
LPLRELLSGNEDPTQPDRRIQHRRVFGHIAAPDGVDHSAPVVSAEALHHREIEAVLRLGHHRPEAAQRHGRDREKHERPWRRQSVYQLRRREHRHQRDDDCEQAGESRPAGPPR